jgi:hypothetical protein
VSTIAQRTRPVSSPYRAGESHGVRWSSLIAVASILGLIFMVAGCILARQGGLLNLLYPVGVLAVGGILYVRHPALYVGFVWWVWFLSPEVRRLVDYQSGWHPQSTVGLAPYLVVGIAMFGLMRHAPKLKVFPLLTIGMACAGLFYAFGVGVLVVGVSAAAFDMLSWLVPVVMAFYFMLNWRYYPDFRRVTQRAFSWGLLLMGLYGIYQFINPPAWDRFWMINADMGVIGSPEPFEVRVFSTLNSPGPLAVVLAAGLLVLLSNGRLRDWPAISAGYAGLLLSVVRSVWGTIIVGALVLIAQGGRSRLRLLITLVATALILWPLLSFGPVADVIAERLQTLDALERDTSFMARLQTYVEWAPQALGQVWGMGMGSTGVATKLTNVGTTGEGYATALGGLDLGIIAIPLTLGWPGTLLYVGGAVWLLVYALRAVRRSDAFVMACRSIVIMMLAQFVFGNVTTGVNGMILWGFLGLAAAAQMYYTHNARTVGEAPETPRAPDARIGPVQPTNLRSP